MNKERKKEKEEKNQGRKTVRRKEKEMKLGRKK